MVDKIDIIKIHGGEIEPNFTKLCKIGSIKRKAIGG